MLMMQYAHRLPADYDMGKIRERAHERGPSWDATPGLGFKAFVARERGHDGADDNLYSSIYLWRQNEAAVSFLTDDRFGSVVATFGRPLIETWMPFDLQIGELGAEHARTITRTVIEIEPGRALHNLQAAERERNLAEIKSAGVIAAVSAIDLASWRLVRFTLSASDRIHAGARYEILHLARPEWSALTTPNAKRAG